MSNNSFVVLMNIISAAAIMVTTGHGVAVCDAYLQRLNKLPRDDRDADFTFVLPRRLH